MTAFVPITGTMILEESGPGEFGLKKDKMKLAHNLVSCYICHNACDYGQWHREKGQVKT